jgi:hypothetical protein
MSRIVVMGSGETAPTMVRVHRDVFAASPVGPAVMLDTPFAFQENRTELVSRTRGYFADSVGQQVEVATWGGGEEPGVRERSLALLDRAAWAFAGPGSPTYALRHWRDTPLPAALEDVVRRGGTLVLGSAAAVTLGAFAVPVYEIYKVGADPAWAEGLDLLGRLTGIEAAVVPHFDNKEGGTHDTRFCYLGEQRLSVLEDALPDDVGVLGVDEHTAVVFDMRAGTAAVTGNGLLTVRRRGHAVTFAAGEVLPFSHLSALLRGETPAGDAPPPSPPASPSADDDRPALSLRAEADRCRAAFDTSLERRDVDGCVAAVLGLEQALADWQSDTLQSDDADHARRVLRALVVRLGELAEQGAADPAGRVAPYVEALLDLRRAARDAGDFATADQVRDRLTAAGVEVHDTTTGTDWDLHG